MRKRTSTIIACCGMLLIALSAGGKIHAATVLLSNLDSPNGSTNLITQSTTNAINFTVTGDFSLANLTVSERLLTTGFTVSPNARIYADSLGAPGALLASLSPDVGTLTSGYQNINFTGDFTFSSGQNYWIEFDTSGGPAEIQTSSAAFSGLAISNLLVARSGNAVTLSLPTPGVDGLALTLTGTPVPLPAAAWLMLSGMGGLCAVVRRRRLM